MWLDDCELTLSPSATGLLFFPISKCREALSAIMCITLCALHCNPIQDLHLLLQWEVWGRQGSLAVTSARELRQLIGVIALWRCWSSRLLGTFQTPAPAEGCRLDVFGDVGPALWVLMLGICAGMAEVFLSVSLLHGTGTGSPQFSSWLAAIWFTSQLLYWNYPKLKLNSLMTEKL